MLTRIHIKYYYTVGALLALCLCVALPYVLLKVIFAWIALSLGLVSSAYWFNSAGIFRKSQDGSIPWYISWSFVPFLMGCQLYNAWARKHDKVPVIQKIDKQLYLACRLFPSDIDRLKHEKIDAILDVTAEFDALEWTLFDENIGYLNIPILDHSVPTVAQLNQAINWLHTQVSNGKNVVVHCALGRGRSVLVLAAYLVCRERNRNVNDVLKSINSIRQTARLNKWQLAAIEKMHSQQQINIHKRAWLIVNPVSGGGKWHDEADHITQTLTDYFQLEVLYTAKDKSAVQLAKQAKQKGADIIVACGGDGTVNEVASVIVDTDIFLGIIPMGTTNALSHTLFGAASKLVPVSQALDILIQGYSQRVDTATCNDELMLLLVGLGFEQKMIAKADRDQKDALGQLAYLNGLWEAVGENQPLSIRVQIDGGDIKVINTTSLVIANAAPFTSLLALGNGEPNITDGLLDITWIESSETSPQQLLSMTELLFAGLTGEREDNQQSQIHHEQAKKIYLNTDSSCQYVIDGELFESEDLCIKVKPRSLNVLVPEASKHV
ncbi:diacylglycerol kinase family protein [Shewanella sp. SR44-4]|jgi:YegS/Rv2252/BmrU family lipid kinase|uniref:diacylglycerol kinase family protein n=1 Tax=unclassified Shewanella TaxID=196818 RepID=UPI001601B8A1|nr:diacylglycerol kinase family protein [Shewanella sp. SR44-4]MBB1364121.1 dual specificity protein phosphatase family protein [Shewanella sp. SR44-4]|tara:strand:+ start:2033 stop:3685 length:1653 start_codon:yes stop_codon:yes gene_type:complete